MKNTMLDRKLTVAILTVFLVICAVPDASHGFFDDLFGIIGDVVETVATVATTVVDVAVAVVDVAVGVVEITVGVVDLTVRLAANLVGHTGCVLATAFDPYGAILASGGCDYDVLLWDILTGGITLTLRHVSAVLSLAFCAVDGCVLASGTENGLLNLWIPETGELKTTLTGHTGAVLEHGIQSGRSSRPRQRERRLDCSAMEYGDRPAHTRTLEGHTDSVSSIAFRLDGEYAGQR